jgi:hypothetical protein
MPTSTNSIEGRLGLVSKLGITTERIRSSPRAMLWTSTVTLARRRAFCITATARTARTTPGIVPEPPKMLTPPSRTTVTTVSVMPCAASARALDRRDVRITPAMDAMSPDRTKSPILTRVTRTPEKRAVPGFLPMAKTWRPTQVRWRTIPSTMASRRKMTNGHGTSVPGT